VGSGVIEDALRLVKQRIPNVDSIVAEEVRIGVRYAGVRLSTGDVGLCYSFPEELRPIRVARGAGTLSGKPAIKIACMSRSWDLSQSVVGVAALNALSQAAMRIGINQYRISEGGISKSIRIKRSDVVVMVGYMVPIAEAIRGRVKHLYILERNPQLRFSDALLDTVCEDVLPRADVAVITGSAIPNKTIDRLLSLAQGAREICVVGPTAGIIPDALFSRGVTMVGCVKVLEPHKIMRIISEGGGARALSPAAKFICIRPKV